MAILVGVTGVSVFFCSFLGLILGSLPILLILGGALAFYLGFTDVQEKKKDPSPEPGPQKIEPPATTDTDTPPVQEEETQVPEVPDPTESIEPEKSVQPAPTLFKGNAETLVFHSIDCKFSQGKKCTAEFTTREEAVEQGYKPCKVCKP